MMHLLRCSYNANALFQPGVRTDGCWLKARLAGCRRDRIDNIRRLMT